MIIKKKKLIEEVKPKKKAAPALSLPEEPETIEPDPSSFLYFIYGIEGIGKSSFTAMFPDTLHFFTEPSGRDLIRPGLAGFFRNLGSWKEFVGYIDLLEEAYNAGKLKHKIAVLDTADVIYKWCVTEWCAEHDIEAPRDNYGKDWGYIKEVWRNEILRLNRLMGCIVVSHAAEKQTTHLDGNIYDMYVPKLTASGADIIHPIADLTGFYWVNPKGYRELVIQPNTFCKVKNRIGSRFRYTNGKAMDSIPMGTSKEEAWENFEKAFHNNMEEPKPSESKEAKTTIKKKKEK